MPTTQGGAETKEGSQTDTVFAADLVRGKEVFHNSCAGCHGYRGNGQGPVSGLVHPKPRNFLAGTFKFRSTPTGEFPLDMDLVHTISDGLHGTVMPPFAAMDRRDMMAVISYIKKLYSDHLLESLVEDEFGDDEPDPDEMQELKDVVASKVEGGQPIEIPPEPIMDDASIRRGENLFRKLGCFECHGMTGRGDGSSANSLVDDWGDPIRPADFTLSGGLKTGSDPRMIYRTFMTGLDGTPMPSFGAQLTPEDAWDLTHYVFWLRRVLRR
ncbi:MAG: c-type cytochrome [Planctomycetota bacterium]